MTSREEVNVRARAELAFLRGAASKSPEELPKSQMYFASFLCVTNVLLTSNSPTCPAHRGIAEIANMRSAEPFSRSPLAGATCSRLRFAMYRTYLAHVLT